MKKKFIRRLFRIGLALLILFFLIGLSSCSKNSQKAASQETETLPYEELLIIGQRQYHLRRCINCHGRTGEGNGYKAQGVSPDSAPRNFKDLTGYLQGSGLNNIVFTIRHGITNRPPVSRRGLLSYLSGTTLTNHTYSSIAMPSYPHLTDEEIFAISHYVMYLQTNTIIK